MTATRDERFPFPGYSGCDSVCRLRVFERTGQFPVVVATELPDNTGTSITNAAERVAAMVAARYFAHADGAQPFVWIEHYPDRNGRFFDPLFAERFARVDFSHYRLKPSRLYGRWVATFGEPSWTDISREEVEGLIGEPFPSSVPEQSLKRLRVEDAVD